MPELMALVETINQLNAELEHTQESLDGINIRLDKLPEKYLPRDEAAVKAKQLRIKARNLIIALIIGGVIAATAGINLNHRFTHACIESRESLQAIINTAVADRQPLSTSSPETRAALEVQNETQVRPLREKLLSLDGVDPGKC